MKIISKNDDLALITPEHGTYLFKNYCLTSFNISIDSNIHEISSIFSPNQPLLFPGMQTITLDIKLTARSYKHSDEKIDQYNHLSVLELFNLVENKLGERNG
jgi:hypothetical protein